MDQYTHSKPTTTPSAPIRTRRRLVLKRLSKRQLAQLVLDVKAGKEPLPEMTNQMLARAFDVSPATVSRLKNGGHRPSLADRLMLATPKELIEAGRKLGCQWVWDRLIDPVIR